MTTDKQEFTEIVEQIGQVDARCGECEQETTFLPVVRAKRSSGHELAWRCTSCGWSLE